MNLREDLKGQVASFKKILEAKSSEKVLILFVKYLFVNQVKWGNNINVQNLVITQREKYNLY